MVGQYLKKIIAKSPDDLQFISACCHQAKVKISDIKYLLKNKIFIISLERYNKETEEKKTKISSIIKFEFIESTKSKKIDQKNSEKILKLITIDVLKKNHNYEIILFFSGNSYISLQSEIIDVELIDQTKVE